VNSAAGRRTLENRDEAGLLEQAHAARTDRCLALLHVSQGGGISNGVRRALSELSDAQLAVGHRVLVHLSGPDSFDDHFPASRGETVPMVRSELSGPAALGFSRAGERWVDSPTAASFGILHQHGIWQAHARITRRWRARYGRPTVVSPHGALQRSALRFSSWKKQLAMAGYERRNLHEASCLHATAEQEIAGFRDLGLRNPVAVIPNGASDEWISSSGNAHRFRLAHGLGASRRLMLYLSRIHPTKNLLGLLDAMARTGDALSDWHLVVAGPSAHRAYHAQMRRAVQELGLGDRVHWTGELRGQDKRDAFAAAELLVLPTLGDSFAIVVAESLAAGVPVLTTREALPWSLLEEHDCGWWVPLTSMHLSRALQQATRLSGHQLAAMGVRGRALVERQFRWIDIADRTTELYAWLLGLADRPDFVVLD
jgi:glycosyltransferase involved in cell wall biosynthesis